MNQARVDVVPYDLVLDYDYWSYGMRLYTQLVRAFSYSSQTRL